MKERILIVTVICGFAGLLGWFLNPPPKDAAGAPAIAKAAPAAEAPKPEVKAAVMVAPKAPTPLAQPVAVEAAKPAAPAASGKADYLPQADLAGCIDQTIMLIAAKDYLGLVKASAPPDEIQRMISRGRAASLEEIAAQMAQRPNMDQYMSHLQQVMETIKNQTPEMDTEGTQAVFKIDPAQFPGASKGAELMFLKVDGHWYFGGEGGEL